MLNHQQIQIECNDIFTPEQVLENRGRVAIFIDGSNFGSDTVLSFTSALTLL